MEPIEILRAIIGIGNEAPRYGPFDQIDNDGAPKLWEGDDDDALEMVRNGEKLLITNAEGEEWEGSDSAEETQLVRDALGDEPFTLTTFATATEYGNAEEQLEAAE